MKIEDNNSIAPVKFHFEKVSYFVLTLTLLWSAAGDVNSFFERQVPLIFISALLLAAYLASHKDFAFLKDRVSGAWKGLIGGLVGALASILLLNFFTIPEHLLNEFKNTSTLGVVLFLLFSVPLWEVFSRKIYTPLWGAASVAFLDAVLFGIGTQNAAVFLFTFCSCWASALTLLKFGFPAAIVARVLSTALPLLYLFQL